MKHHRPDSAPPGKFDVNNRSRVTGGETHPMIAYYNSSQIQRYNSLNVSGLNNYPVLKSLRVNKNNIYFLLIKFHLIDQENAHPIHAFLEMNTAVYPRRTEISVTMRTLLIALII